MSMQQLASSQVHAEVVVNENMETLEHQSVFGKRHPATAGLTWGYYGGRWGGASVADGTLSLTASQTNYIVVERATGTISFATTNTNWNNTTDYARVYLITTNASAVTAVQDHRAGPGGVHGQSDSSGGATALADLTDVDISGSPAIDDGDVLTYEASSGTWVAAAPTGGGSNAFSTIAVSGQSDVVADSSSDTLTLVAGSGITITTNAGGDSVQIAASGGGSGELKGLAFTSDSATNATSISSGQLRWNNGTQSNAGTIYLSQTTADSIGFGTLVDRLVAFGTIYLQQANDATKWQLWLITGIDDQSTYVGLAVTSLAYGGSISTSAASVLALIQNGAAMPINVSGNSNTVLTRNNAPRVNYATGSFGNAIELQTYSGLQAGSISVIVPSRGDVDTDYNSGSGTFRYDSNRYKLAANRTAYQMVFAVPLGNGEWGIGGNLDPKHDPNKVNTLTDAATIAVDAAWVNHKVTLGGNRTLGAPTNTAASGWSSRLAIRVKQDATGSRTLAYNSVYKFAGGTAPTLTTGANATDYLEFQWDGADGTWFNTRFVANIS